MFFLRAYFSINYKNNTLMNFKTTTSFIKAIKPIMLLLILTAILPACSSYQKIPYFQDLDKSQVTSDDITNLSPVVIQANDQLSISVNSLNQDAANIFSNNIVNAGTNAASPVYGYIVDKNGEVLLPLVGLTKVAGLTAAQLGVQLQDKLVTFLSKPIVAVRIVNFKVSVMGDVMHPAIYTSNSERLTITEALTLAGDLNITAKRDDIVLVREIDGKRMFIPIDLTSKKVFESPYFYLKANDLIFVQAGKLKLATVDTGARNASLIISALSLIAISVSLFTR
jgi:polysaccharide export outer membrane protein